MPSSDSRFKAANYRRMTTLHVPGMHFRRAYYGIAFMNLRAENLDIPAMAIAELAMMLAAKTVVFCGLLQLQLGSSLVKEASP